MPSDKKGPVTTLRENFELLERDLKKLQQDYLRALADFDNYRKRVERDMEMSQRLALERLAIDLLPVLDDFDRAAQAAGEQANAESIRKGMDMIHRQLREVMCRHGIEEYSCLGQEFDPRRAEAIGYVHSEEHKPNMVVTEACKGYRCGQRVLRPARVLVAKAGEESRKAEAKSQDPRGDEPSPQPSPQARGDERTEEEIGDGLEESND
jgi:molecular chaperone GrpE